LFFLRQRLSAYAVYLILESSYAVFFGMIATINLVYQVEVAHLNPLQLVLVGTALEAVCFVCQVPTGALADLYSRRLAVILGTLLAGAGFVLEGSIPRFATILVAQVLWGTGATFINGAEEAWIAGEVGEARVGQTFIRGGQAGLLGGLIGAVISVALGSIRLNLPIVLGGGLMMALGVFLLLAMPERGFQRTPREDRTTWQSIGDTIRNGTRIVRRSPFLLTILAVGAFFGMSGEGFDRLNVAHFLHNFTLPALGPLKPVVWFGIMTVGTTLLGLVAAEIVRRRLDMNNHVAVARTLVAFEAMQVASIMGFGLAGNFTLALATFWGATVFRRTAGPVYMAWLTQSIEPRVRATVISMSGLVDAFGQIAGGPAIGAIGTFVSLRAALVSAGALLAPVLPLFARAGRQGDGGGKPGAGADDGVEASVGGASGSVE
jgi:DHA3 family tetracycline resistance protein-like MFS transporter